MSKANAQKAETLPTDGHFEPAPEFEFPEAEKARAEIVRQAQPGPIAVTPMRLLEIATSQNADVDKLAKLMELQFRWEANEARKAYYEAMTKFKAEVPPIERTKHVQFKRKDGGMTDYWHAELDKACDKLVPLMAKYGLTHKWRTEQKDGKIRVTCVVSHEMGHSADESSLEAAPDESGSKNPVQAIGSTTYYLERYTLFAAAGVAVKGQDNDAKPLNDWEPLKQCLEAIKSAPDYSALEQIYKAAFKRAKEEQREDAMRSLITAKDVRKAELAQENPA